MAQICAARSTRFTIPSRDYAGTPVGIDARLVVELGITPQITTGVLHARAGTGQIGAGVAHQPVAPFRAALARSPRRWRSRALPAPASADTARPGAVGGPGAPRARSPPRAAAWSRSRCDPAATCGWPAILVAASRRRRARRAGRCRSSSRAWKARRWRRARAVDARDGALEIGALRIDLGGLPAIGTRRATRRRAARLRRGLAARRSRAALDARPRRAPAELDRGLAALRRRRARRKRSRALAGRGGGLTPGRRRRARRVRGLAPRRRRAAALAAARAGRCVADRARLPALRRARRAARRRRSRAARDPRRRRPRSPASAHGRCRAGARARALRSSGASRPPPREHARERDRTELHRPAVSRRQRAGRRDASSPVPLTRHLRAGASTGAPSSSWPSATGERALVQLERGDGDEILVPVRGRPGARRARRRRLRRGRVRRHRQREPDGAGRAGERARRRGSTSSRAASST